MGKRLDSQDLEPAAVTRGQGMSAEEHLVFHQDHSKPVNGNAHEGQSRRRSNKNRRVMVERQGRRRRLDWVSGSLYHTSVSWTLSNGFRLRSQLEFFNTRGDIIPLKAWLGPAPRRLRKTLGATSRAVSVVGQKHYRILTPDKPVWRRRKRNPLTFLARNENGPECSVRALHARVSTG